MQNFVQGNFLMRGEVISPFVKAEVVSFDPEGGLLENPEGDGYCTSRNAADDDYYEIKARIGPTNPPRSLRGRIITQHWDRNSNDDNLRVFWPLFPSIGVDPVPLEYVYVFFDNNDRRHGLWVSRVAGPGDESQNLAQGDAPYIAAAETGGQKESKASLFGDEPQPQKDYTTQQAIVGSEADDSDKTQMEYS